MERRALFRARVRERERIWDWELVLSRPEMRRRSDIAKKYRGTAVDDMRKHTVLLFQVD